MADQGWQMAVDPKDGGIEPSGGGISDDQIDTFDAAIGICNDSIETPTFATMSGTEWLEMYDALVEEARCIRGTGFSIKATPSNQVFEERDGGWSTQGDLKDFDPKDLVAIESECPRNTSWEQ